MYSAQLPAAAVTQQILTHTGTHAYTHIHMCVHTHTQRLRHLWSKPMSCESKTVSCAPHPPTFLHLTIDKSRRQVHTAVDHALYEVTAQPRLHTSTHPIHSRTCVNARTRTNKHTQHWLGHTYVCQQQGTRGLTKAT